MQIESAYYSTKRVEDEPKQFVFKPDRLNLLCTEEEQSKSDLFTTISNIISSNKDETISGGADLKEGSLYLRIDDQQIVLKRNFQEKQLDFSPPEAEKIANDQFAGVSKEMFQTLLLIGQDEGSSSMLADRGVRLNLLGQLASKTEQNRNIERAIRLVEEKQERYPFKGKNYRIDDLLTGLNRGKVVLEERLGQLERERAEAGSLIDELKQLESEQVLDKDILKREEYFSLCLETAELDARIMMVQQKLYQLEDLNKQIRQFEHIANFPVSGQRKVQELWVNRQSRLADLQRHDDELLKSIQDTKAQEDILTAHNEELEQFTIEDSQQLFGLSKTIAGAQAEIEQLRQERDKEMRRVKDAGVRFDDIALIRKTVLGMSPSDIETANTLANDLKRQKDKLQTLVEFSQGTGVQLKELHEEIKGFDLKFRKIRNVLLSLVVASALIVLFSLTGEQEVLGTIFQTSFVLSVAGLLLLPPLLSGVRKQFESKVEGLIQQQGSSDQKEINLSDLIAKIQSEGEQIAHRYGMESSAELFKKLQTYAMFAGRLKQLDILEQMLETREQNLQSLSKEGMVYLEKVNRGSSIVTAAAISVLASEILWHRESMRKLERSTAVVNHRKSERKFLEGELAEIDAVLVDYFERAALRDPENIDDSFEEFESQCKVYRNWESLKQELERVESEISNSDVFETDLTEMLAKLQHRRADAWNFMQELIAKYPDILGETIEDEEIGRMGHGDLQKLHDQIEGREERINALRNSVREAIKNFDEFHPKTQHEVEILERDLVLIRRNRASLNLAKETLMRVARESKTSWSQELAAISTDMLADMDLDVAKIDWDDNLDITVTLRDQDQTLHESELDAKCSRGLRQQISWIMRLMLCRYIVNRLPLPVVLDEPFCDLDDRRFTGCMDLLIHKVLPHCQLIVLTSQKVRHKWFIENLPFPDKTKIAIV